MAFRFRKASCVAVGTFNIYIVQPPWLTTKGIIPENVEVAIESKMDEPGFRYSSEQFKTRWFVTPTRIAIESEDETEDCGSLMAQLLKWFPETPLMAVGNNAYYEDKSEERAILDLPAYPVPETLPGDSLRQRSFHVAVGRGECLFNLQLSVAEERVDLLMNCHCPIGSGLGPARAQEHAKLFMEHRRAGVILTRHHLKVDIHV